MWFKGWGRVPEFSHDKTEEVTSLSTVFQKCWKKSEGIPSGLGAFNGVICFKADNTSSSLNSRHKEEFISSVITVGTWVRTLLDGSILADVNSYW